MRTVFTCALKYDPLMYMPYRNSVAYKCVFLISKKCLSIFVLYAFYSIMHFHIMYQGLLYCFYYVLLLLLLLFCKG